MDRPIRTALFVDFDNVFGSLYRLRRSAADAFGMHPARWLRFFEDGRHAGGRGGEHQERALLMRKCYMNPDGFITSHPNGEDDEDNALRAAEPSATAEPVQFRQFRRFFTSAGFSVIDCPALTRRAKNSADIVMAMDIMDALAHKVMIEEFIILSADADFTPVLIRLREHDRRTAVYANKFTAVAYRAASDVLIGEHDFMARALEEPAARSAARAERTSPAAPSPPPTAPSPPTAVIAEIARAVAEALPTNRREGMTVPDLARFLRQFPAFAAPNAPRWLGFGTAVRMITELARSSPTIGIDSSHPELIRLYRKLPVSRQLPWARAARPFLTRRTTTAPAPRQGQGHPEDLNSFTTTVLDAVRAVLDESPVPVLMSIVGSQVRQLVPDLPAKRWPKAATLAGFLNAVNDPRIRILSGPRTMVYDPERHAVAADGQGVIAPPVEAEAPSHQDPGAPPELEQAAPAPEPAAAAVEAPDIIPDVGTWALAELPPLLADPDLAQAAAPAVLAVVEAMLADATTPLAFEDVLAQVHATCGDDPAWPDGAESLEAYVRSGAHPTLAILEIEPGFLYDRDRHDPFALTEGEGDAPSPALRALVDLIVDITECPALLPARHRVLWRAVTDELGGGAFDLQSQWGMHELEQAVETRCQDMGARLSPPTIRYVMEQLAGQGALTSAVDAGTPHRLAAAYAEALAELCRVNQQELSEDEATMLRHWIDPDLADPSPPLDATAT